MKKEKLLLAVILFMLGLTGILSILTMELPLPEEAKEALLEIFTPGQIKWLVLINPTIMFAVGHFPIVFQTVEHPPGLLLGYILIGNAIGGIIFGWLYWKSGLESAFLAHIAAHVVMVLAEPLLV
ncbi:MAG: CPBP family intramembrane metalloprotease [Saprospiraceae bacterium]|nr:CPBP family intramembrane metalloprotease [Saprospiraceae bacterium]